MLADLHHVSVRFCLEPLALLNVISIASFSKSATPVTVTQFTPVREFLTAFLRGYAAIFLRMQ